MLERLIAWLRGLFAPKPKPALTALEAMDSIHRDKLPRADAAAWKKARSNFLSRVFSESDRKRLWRRHRRNVAHASEAWEPSRPTTADLKCLEGILETLARS